MAERIALTIDIESSSLKELNDEIKKQTKILKENFKVGEEGYEEQAKLVAALKAEEKGLKDELRDKQKAYTDVEKTGVGSYKALNKELIDARKAFKNLSKAEREGKAGEELKKRIQELDKELKDIDASIGLHQRNVGNYNSVWDGVNSKLKGGVGAFGQVASSMGGAGAAVGGFASELAMATGPLGVVLAAVGALAGAVNMLIGDSLERFESLNVMVAKTGDLTDHQVARISAKVATLSDVFGEENEEIVKAAQQMAKGFGISFEDALKQVETGFRNGANANGEFVDSLKEYSALAKDAGMNAKQYRQLLEAQAAEGVYADKLADSMKEANIKLREFKKGTAEALQKTLGKEFADEIAKGVKTGTLSTIDAMQQISVKAKEVGLNNQQLSELTTNVFGTMAEDIGTSKILDIYANFEDKTIELSGSAKKAQEAMERQMDSVEKLGIAQSKLTQTLAPLQQDMSTFFNNMKTQSIDALNSFLQTYGTKIVKVLKDVVNFLSGILDTYGGAWMELFDTIKDIGVEIGAIFDNLGTSASSSVGLIEAAVQIVTVPLRSLAFLYKQVITAIRVGTDKIVEMGAAMGITYFENIKSAKDLAEVERLRANFAEEEVKAREEMQSFLRQQVVGEFNLQTNLNKIKKLSFDEQREFWEDHKRHLGIIKMQNKNISDEEAKSRAMEAAAIDFRQKHFEKRKNADKVQIKDLKTKADLEKAAKEAKRKADKERREREKKAAKESKNAIKEAVRLTKVSLIDAREIYEKSFTPFQQAIMQYDLIIKKQKELEKAQESGASVAVVKEMAKELAYINGEHTKTLGLLSEQQMSLFELRTAFKSIGEETPRQLEELNIMGNIFKFNTEEEKAKFLENYTAITDGAIEVTQLASDTIFDIESARIDALEAKRMASIDNMYNREVEQARGNSVLIQQAEERRVKRQEELEKEMAKKRKAQAIKQAIINGALAVTQALATTPFPLSIAKSIEVGLIAAGTVATITQQSFAKGGVINGPSHAQGGVPVYGAGGKFAEVEGGEAIINKRSTSMYKPLLSAINVAGGGRKFAMGGVMPSMERVAEMSGFNVQVEQASMISTAIDRLTDRQPVVVLDTFQEESNKFDNYNKTKVQ